MRFIKRQSTNLRSLAGKGVHYDINDLVILDSTNSVLLPTGTSGERTASAVNGRVRYNTSLDGDGNEIGVEIYYNGWRRIRFKEPNANPGIQVQTLGVGDAVEDTFGILDSGDPDYPAPAAAQNVLVFIENVYQLPGTNYTLVQNPSGLSPSTGLAYPAGWYLVFGSPVPFGKPVTVIHNFDK
jgi:hypothetical protein